MGCFLGMEFFSLMPSGWTKPGDAYIQSEHNYIIYSGIMYGPAEIPDDFAKQL
jgi:hypothetical protein